MRGSPEGGIELLRHFPILSICLEESRTRRELAEMIDTSRSTIYRTTVALTERELLEHVDGGYRTTVHGAALVSTCERFLTGVEVIEELEPLFDLVSHPELLANAHLFTDPTVTVADASNPYRVVDLVVERFEQTSTSKGTIINVTSPEALERVVPTLGEKQSIERVFTESALESHRTIGEGAFATEIDAESIDLFVAADDVVPFSFAIDDAAVTIVGHDQQMGLPTVHVSSTSVRARTWLETLYTRCREAATNVERD